MINFKINYRILFEILYTSSKNYSKVIRYRHQDWKQLVIELDV